MKQLERKQRIEFGQLPAEELFELNTLRMSVMRKLESCLLNGVVSRQELCAAFARVITEYAAAEVRLHNKKGCTLKRSGMGM